MRTKLIFLTIGYICSSLSATADDGKGLNRGADSTKITISGVSSGGAMAIQYAIAHSATIAGVGAIAAPTWGCASGKFSQAINSCMCSTDPINQSNINNNLQYLHGTNLIDAVDNSSITNAYIFHSKADKTVKAESADVNKNILLKFIKHDSSTEDRVYVETHGTADHGIISPSGPNKCENQSDDHVQTYVRKCGEVDNAGKLLSLFYRKSINNAKRKENITLENLWTFDQQLLINEVKKDSSEIGADGFFIFPYKTKRRENFDMAELGYIYVPDDCKAHNSQCGVHIALHGCKQNAKEFAQTSGYANWADYYKVIMVFPATAMLETKDQADEVSCKGRVSKLSNYFSDPNPNGCWDWWGYLDKNNIFNLLWYSDTDNKFSLRYLGKNSPQIKVLNLIIRELTKPQ